VIVINNFARFLRTRLGFSYDRFELRTREIPPAPTPSPNLQPPNNFFRICFFSFVENIFAYFRNKE
jgi:hypothetical protein